MDFVFDETGALTKLAASCVALLGVVVLCLALRRVGPFKAHLKDRLRAWHLVGCALLAVLGLWSLLGELHGVSTSGDQVTLKYLWPRSAHTFSAHKLTAIRVIRRYYKQGSSVLLELEGEGLHETSVASDAAPILAAADALKAASGIPLTWLWSKGRESPQPTTEANVRNPKP